MVFRPTYLYIKQHTITGKLYFGKTVKHPKTYHGSGIAWNKHRKEYGYSSKYVVNLWYQLYDNPFDLVADAISMSNAFDVVNNDSWLNLIPEVGLSSTDFSPEHRFILLDGTITEPKTNFNFALEYGLNYKSMCNAFHKGILYYGYGRVGGKNEVPSKRVCSDETKEKIRKSLVGKTQSIDKRIKSSIRVSGENNPMYGKTGALNPKYGKRGNTHSKESRRKMSKNSSKYYDVEIMGIQYIKLTITEISSLFDVSLQMLYQKLSSEGIYKGIKLIHSHEKTFVSRKHRRLSDVYQE